MPSMFVTDEVIKLLKSKDINEWHWPNMPCIFWTDFVLKLLTSKEVIELQL